MGHLARMQTFLLSYDHLQKQKRVLVKWTLSWLFLGQFGTEFITAPDRKMNRMNGIRFTRNTQNACPFGKFLAGNPTQPPAPVPSGFWLEDVVVLRSPPP